MQNSAHAAATGPMKSPNRGSVHSAAKRTWRRRCSAISAGKNTKSGSVFYRLTGQNTVMPDPGSKSRTGSFDPASSKHLDPGCRCAPVFHRFFLALTLNYKIGRRKRTTVQCSMLSVGCWMFGFSDFWSTFSAVQRSQLSNQLRGTRYQPVYRTSMPPVRGTGNIRGNRPVVCLSVLPG